MHVALRLELAHELEQFTWDGSQWLTVADARLYGATIAALRLPAVPWDDVLANLVDVVRRRLWDEPDVSLRRNSEAREDLARAWPRLHALLLAAPPDSAWRT